MSEQRYTLEEARQQLARRECRQWGHDLEQTRTFDGETVRVHCDRCGDVFLPTRRTGAM